MQHFGYRFNYETRNLDAPRNMCPIPEFITEMVKSKLTNQQSLSSSTENDEQNKPEGCDSDDGVGKREENKLGDMIMTQMTINEYYPGQGIASHIGMSCHSTDVYIQPASLILCLILMYLYRYCGLFRACDIHFISWLRTHNDND